MAAASDSSHQSGRAPPPVSAATAACAPPTAAMELISSWAESEARAAGRSIWPETRRGERWSVLRERARRRRWSPPQEACVVV